jgi:hypothetical protein
MKSYVVEFIFMNCGPQIVRLKFCSKPSAPKLLLQNFCLVDAAS